MNSIKRIKIVKNYSSPLIKKPDNQRIKKSNWLKENNKLAKKKKMSKDSSKLLKRILKRPNQL